MSREQSEAVMGRNDRAMSRKQPGVAGIALVDNVPNSTVVAHTIQQQGGNTEGNLVDMAE